MIDYKNYKKESKRQEGHEEIKRKDGWPIYIKVLSTGLEDQSQIETKLERVGGSLLEKGD